MEAVTDDISFRPAWRLNDPQLVRDARHLWSLAKIPPHLVHGRESEICAVAYSGGEAVAVSTASLFYDPSMRHKFFGYRCMVAPQARQQNLAWRISTCSLKLLQEWSAQNAHERALGLMICVETDKFETGLRRPVREKFGFTMHFVGYTQAGQQLRVVWFDDAMLDDSAVKQKGSPAGQRQSG